MKRALLISMLLTALAGIASGCGPAKADPEKCATNFSALQAKMDTLSPQHSSKAQVVTAAGEPSQIVKTLSGEDDYRYDVYEDAGTTDTPWCGQYQLIFSGDTLGSVQKFEEYKD